MKYLDYLNDFNRWLESNTLPGNAQLLYFRLLNVFNRAGWPEHVQVDTLRLMVFSDSKSEKTARLARDKLAECGLIRFEKGKKGVCTSYYLRELKQVINTGEKLPGNSCLESRSESFPVSYPEFCRESSLHNKNKIIDKEDIDIPHSPQKRKDGEEKYHSNLFDEFWKAYPRRVGKADAIKAWKKLKPDESILATMIVAINKQRQTEQWQNEKFIPYPASWLNGRRWEDEIPEPKPIRKNDGYDDYRT